MKLTNSISAGIARMESKLMGVSTTSNEMETGSMSGTELIGTSVCIFSVYTLLWIIHKH